MDNVERLCDPNYVPSQQDVLRSRLATVGIAETDFLIQGYPFKLLDVGGQRNERRKWIHCFEEVTAIIYLVGLSEFVFLNWIFSNILSRYDQVLFEDETQNRMMESLLLFEEIVNLKYFRKTGFIVFFNKNDLFKEKIKKVDLKVCFPEYTGRNL